MIPAEDVERVIEGAQPVQREDAGFREQIATEPLRRRGGSGTKSDDERREDE